MPFPASTVLGYPRIGPRRELKRALEAYWDGRADRADLDRVGADLRAQAWRTLAGKGLGGLPSNTFSEYDHVLDTAVLLGAVPDRYRDQPDPYFAMARGTAKTPPLRMTKWFNTNYHYIVPELGRNLRLDATKPLAEIAEARALGHETRPVFVGPVTFLHLAGADPARLPEVLDEYEKLLSLLAAERVEWVQFDEPAFVTDVPFAAYDRLGAVADRPKLLVATYFGDADPVLPALVASPVEAIALDLVHGAVPTLPLTDKIIVAGVVSGRDVWRTDRGAALATLYAVRDLGASVAVGTSSSLMHVPYDLDLEPDLDDALRARLAFADQKVAEVVDLAAAFASGEATGPVSARGGSVVDRVSAPAVRRGPYAARRAAQERLGLPPLPTTTIGSFPQTGELRAARSSLAAGDLGVSEYEKRIEAEIERVIRLQERLGLDVLVHGEPERNDMVQYFAEHLDGFAVTRHGWVQSYGSRCTRPPILHGDVRRAAPITLRWTAFARSLTDRPVKGMLTGPVTIVAWSFVRTDLPLRDVVTQVADAVAAEVADLSAAGVPIIQVDEPALRELLPLRHSSQAEYLSWAVEAYRRATSSAPDGVQVHTHLCYSDADQIVAAIDGLDADVTTIESARSHGRILPSVAAFDRGLGPGVYDIHSPRIPSVDEVSAALADALAVLPRDRVWANPDCGLKTRTYEQVEAALSNLVEAAHRNRAAP
ncbi:5-methyltetrahydropteroyltriglutamate--homocysteine S-methyltransferase [Virgisporangium aurantiacum]|uniref:5-methyltetrahydropteroyltriglutamate--homocysteine S-methyltransferase n=1 Tax=Virgisporangium aurantiacum TaxID=175570 RepID=A0A8J4DWJ9_9ACTN|nr:5-methyltetrahydropteroyltriglutamate--homocysteine S-methyltransferase [Virgisporangium aurantiacum]GIJ52586.1 5-methyltetrahydropteroyltriglutamate--homocysteine methyltransferase [Virgisporangium aurantiacum]